MAVAAVRLLWLLFFQALALVSAAPHSDILLPRANPIISNNSGTVEVFDPSTLSPIPQAPATDGGGSDFDPPALIWIAFSLGIGIPMAFAGIRGWRLTTGTGIGLAVTICGKYSVMPITFPSTLHPAWAALNNTVNAPGLSDILITLISIGFFGLGFAIGVFEFARLGAIVLLSLSGGVAFGARIVLIKHGLLFSDDDLYAANLAIIAVFGAAAGSSLIWAQRIGIVRGNQLSPSQQTDPTTTDSFSLVHLLAAFLLLSVSILFSTNKMVLVGACVFFLIEMTLTLL